MTTSGPIARALADSLRLAKLPPRDAVGVALARRYAQLLDAARDTDTETEVFDSLGPKYLAALTALGLTPAGRAKDGKGGDQVASPAANALAALRTERGAATRPHHAEDLDASAS